MKHRILGILIIFVFLIFGLTTNNYAAPVQGGGAGGSQSTTIDDVFEDANNFVEQGKDAPINQGKLEGTIDFLYNLFLGAGIIVAVLVGIGIGIHYMIASVNEKADLKKSLFWYAVSCGVLFAAFTIWKLAILIFSKV